MANSGPLGKANQAFTGAGNAPIVNKQGHAQQAWYQFFNLVGDGLDSNTRMFVPGDIKVTSCDTLDPGWVPANGVLVKISDFPDLYDATKLQYPSPDGVTFPIANLTGPGNLTLYAVKVY